MKKWITALTFALALLVLSACSAQPGKTAAETEAKKADTEKLLVGFSNWSRSFEFYVDIETGMKEKADELGIELITQDANSDLTEQTKQLENYITRKVDGIIIVPIDSEAAGDEVQMVNDAGIPIVTLDIAVTGGGTVNSHLESNNYMGGEKSADFIAEQLGGKGTVAVIDNPTITSLIARTDGFTNTIAENIPTLKSSAFRAVTPIAKRACRSQKIFYRNTRIWTPSTVRTMQWVWVLCRRYRPRV